MIQSCYSVHGVVVYLGVLAVLLTNSEPPFGGQLLGYTATIFLSSFITSLIVWSIPEAVIGNSGSEEEE